MPRLLRHPQHLPAALLAPLWLAAAAARAQAPEPVIEEEVAEEVAEPAGGDGPAVAPRYVVDAVEVRGNWKTADAVIRARVDLRAGEFLDEEKLEVSRLRLVATGFFRDVTTKLERGGARNHVIVVFQVTETVPIPIVEGVFLGFSQVTPLFAGLSLVDNNFLGKGITVGVGGVASPRQQAIRARIIEPSILGSSLGLRARLLFNNGQEPIALGSSATAGGTVSYRRVGGSGGIMLTEGWVGRFAMDYRFELLWGELRLVPGASRPPRLLPGVSRLSTLTLSFERDTRNRLFVPTEGSVLRFAAEGSSALLLSDYEYAKFRAGYEALLPLRRLWSPLAEHALSLRLEAGYIQSGLPTGGESGAPFFEEFYVGDTSYFRYQRNSLPRYFGMNFAPFNEYGDALFTVGGEYDFPIVSSGSSFLYRAYLYGAWDVTEVTRVRDVTARRLRGRLFLDHFTPTFDAGIKLDTLIGTFTFSGSYAVDLIL
ncbi:MAG: BamA/TamA family outer membrane protein [Deltaproteobacteria bacterium]|nr:BamA/TamA family outer membrane protein [Deltaproteobacteria bacterium]